MTVLAAAPSSAFDQPGTLGFLVVAGMGVILVFLFRSMTKHLRKVSGAGRGSGLPGQAGQLGPGNGPSSTGAGQVQATVATVAPTGAADQGGAGGAASGDGTVPGDTGASGSAF